MTPREAHNALRPDFPRPLPPATDPTYQAWLKAYTAWLAEKERLVVVDAVSGRLTPAEVRDRTMKERACSPRADSEWRDISAPKAKSPRPPQPAWSGATKTYNREKQAERRARVKAAVLEVQAERKAS